jgi:hypothetical protein
MPKFSLFLFVIFAYFSIDLIGQDIEGFQQINLIDFQSNKLYKLNLKNQECQEFTAKGFQETHRIKLANIKISDFPLDLVAHDFQLSPHKFLITIEGTGQTYLYDTFERILTRKDKTYFRGYNFGAIQFIRQDTLISLGGHGFWRIHNIPTFFHKSLKEWELFGSINEKGPKGISSQFGGYSPKTDQIYCLEFPLLYTENNDNNYPLYTFNFKENNWNKLGYVDFNKLELKNFNKFASKWIPPYFFSYEISTGEFIDPIENKIYRYRGKNHAFFHFSTRLFIKNNYIYSYQKVFNQNKFDLTLDSMTINQLKLNSVIIGDFYTPKNLFSEIEWKNSFKYLIVFIISVLISSIFQRFSNKQKQASDTWNHLPEYGEVFLNYLSKQSNYACSTEKVNEILNCESKTIESQRQYRSKFINAINDFFERYFNVPNAIIRHQSETDKRYVDYLLSPEAVDIINKRFK